MCRTNNSTSPLKVNVTVESHVFEPLILCLLRISFTLGRIFIKFWTNVRLGKRCAEPITQPCKVKVTIEDHEIEPWFSCPLHIFSTPCRIFINIWLSVGLSEMMRRNNNSNMPIQGQVQNWSHVWTLNFVSAQYLLYHWRIFIKLWSNVRLSKTMCRIQNTTMPNQGHIYVWS